MCMWQEKASELPKSHLSPSPRKHLTVVPFAYAITEPSALRQLDLQMLRHFWNLKDKLSQNQLHLVCSQEGKGKEYGSQASQYQRNYMPRIVLTVFQRKIYIYFRYRSTQMYVHACMQYTYVFIYGFPYIYIMADCPRIYIHIYCPTAHRDTTLQKHTLFYLQGDGSNSSSIA